MYFVEFFWIAEMYSIIALMATYILYIVVTLKMDGGFKIPDDDEDVEDG